MERILQNNKREKGITLVALVVTIIVLLILAFIAISILMGDNGVVEKAKESKEETIKAQEREYIKLAYQDLEMDYKLKGTYITADRVMEKLSEYDKNIKVEMITKDEIGDTEIVVEKNSGEEYAEIVFTETEHKYAGSLVIDQNKARYEVTYNANRGSGGPTKQIKIEGTPLTITLEKPERKGYNFIGWARESTTVVAEYLGGSQYTEDANITLYAVWQLRTDIDPVAQIGGTKYPSIQEAIYECSQETGEEKTTIILLKNTEEEFTTFEGQNIILDLQGHTVTSESEETLCTNNGKLQIINGSLSSNKGTSILNNGEITIGDNSTGIDDNTPTIYGNKVGVDNKGTFNYYDGKIQGIVPIQGTTTSTPDQYGPVQTGYENGISTIQLRILTQYEARIGWVYYETLQGAIDIAKAKETVTLIKDLQLKEILQVGENKDVILDLYGYSLTVATDKDTVIKNYGDLEITDNSAEQTGNITITSTGTCYGIKNDGEKTLKILKGTIDSISNGKSSRIYCYGIYNENNGIIEVFGGNIISKSNNYSYGIYNKKGSVTMSNGTIDSFSYGTGPYTYSYGIFNTAGYIEINGGEVNSTVNNNLNGGGYGSSSYCISNGGILKIVNGNIQSTNTSGWEANSTGITNTGKLEIINGTLSSKIFKRYAQYNCVINNSGEVKINGGIIKNENASSNKAINEYAIINTLSGEIEIDGGQIENSISNKGNGNIKLLNGDISGTLYNDNNGTINIQNVTIEDVKNSSTGSIIIGDKEKTINKENPIILNGLYNKEGNVEFYNGTIQGNSVALSGCITKIREHSVIKKDTIGTKEILYLEENNKDDNIVEIENMQFSSVQKAIDMVEDNEVKTIKLLKDFELNEVINCNKNIKLDLNGHKITNNYFRIENNNILEILDSSEEKNGMIEYTNVTMGLYNGESANLIITAGNIGRKENSVEYQSSSYGIFNSNNGNVIMNGGTIFNSTYGIYNNSKGEIIVNGGKIINNSESSIYGIYNYNIGKISINDIQIQLEGKYSYGIYNYNKGTINVENGIIENTGTSESYGIYNAFNGTINVKGGTITSKGRTCYGISTLNKGVVTDISDVIINCTSSNNSYGIRNRDELYAKNITINCNGSQSYGIYNDGGTIDIENIQIKSNGNDTCYGIYNKSYSNAKAIINIIESNIQSICSKDSYGIFNGTGKLIIGEKEDEIVSQENLYIQGETTDLSKNYEGYGIYNTSGELYYYDGKIQGTDKAVYDTITEIKEGTYLNYNDNETVLTLSTEKLPIAQIGDITYTDLQEAINSVTDENSIIKILRNVTYTSQDETKIIHQGSNITIDLNGFKIISTVFEQLIQNEGILKIIDTNEEKKGILISSEGTTIKNMNNAKLIIDKVVVENRKNQVVYNEGELIIQGCTINSTEYGIYNVNNGTVKVIETTINSSGSSNSYGIYNLNGGIIEVIEGIVNNCRYGIYNMSDGSIKMTGGTVKCNINSYYASYGIYNASSGNIEVTKGNINMAASSSYGIYNASNGKIIIGIKEDEIISQEEPLIKARKTSSSTGSVGYGIYNPNGTLYYYDGKIQGTDKVINGNITEIEDSTEINLSEETVDGKVYKTIILNQVTTNVAFVNGTEYDSIQKAIEACGEVENTIELLRDSNLGATIIIGENQNITIDLKGHTINNYTELQNKGKLKIIDSSSEQTGKIVGLTGTAISNAGILEIQGGAISDSGYGIKNTGMITLNGGKITGNTYGIYNDSNGIINTEQGNISSNTYGIYNYSSSSVTNINEGTITSNEYGIYNYNGTTNITTKGITSNTYGLYVAGGTVTVKEGAEIQSETGIYVSNGTLNIGETGTMNSDSPIITGEIYGLTVTATGKVYMYDGQVKGKTGATEGYITYTEEGYVVANKTEGEYFVDYLALGGTANAVAQVNGVSYSNLQSAINSITGGEEQTIILLNGIVSTETYTISEGQNIKLDMNGKTITSEAEETINNSGNLSIIDTSGKNVAKITSTTGTAIVNSGTLTLGEDEGTVTEGLITIEGETEGIENTEELNFYDGAVIGTTAINGEVNGLPSGYTITTSTVSGKQKATLTQ